MPQNENDIVIRCLEGLGDKVHKYLGVLHVCSILSLNFFFDLKISVMFTFIVTHAHFVKKNHNHTENSNMCEISNGVLTRVCSSMKFYNCRDMIESRK